MTTTDITTIKQSLSPIAEQATSLEIIDDSSLKEAVTLLSQLNQYNDNITQEKERVTKPLNEALKAERSRWKPLETLYTDAIASIRSKMTIYQTNLANTLKYKEESIANRIGTGKGSYTLETATKKLESLPTLSKEHATEQGLVQFREKKQLKITDVDLIPRPLLMPNEAVIMEFLKRGDDVPGCEIETIQVPVNYR